VDLDPNEGEVWLDHQQRSKTPAPAWRKQVGYLPAESRWWSRRVIDHFSHEPLELLQQLALPKECLNWETARLSSGERQRLGLARLLHKGPRALLLDEPTANLDPDNVERVEELIQNYRLHHGASVIWVSHDRRQTQRLEGRRLVLETSGLKEM
jgi:ABC-type iron transport system FetAB ATPase subunit